MLPVVIRTIKVSAFSESNSYLRLRKKNKKKLEDTTTCELEKPRAKSEDFRYSLNLKRYPKLTSFEEHFLTTIPFVSFRITSVISSLLFFLREKVNIELHYITHHIIIRNGYQYQIKKCTQTDVPSQKCSTNTPPL